MARVSIYVSDELKAQMTPLNEVLNWSDIARPAFEQAIANNIKHKDGIMSAIERLRESKKKYEEHVVTNGTKQGRLWAERTASYVDLREISKIDLSKFESDPYGMIQSLRLATDADEVVDFDVWLESMFGFGVTSEEWAYHFAKGAQAVFAEVKDQL